MGKDYIKLTSDDINIAFSKTDNYLIVEITTPKLILRSVTEKDRDNYCSVFGNPEIMRTYATGKPEDILKISDRFSNFVQRWENNNPFSAFVILEKESKAFVGITIFESSEEGIEPNNEGPGVAEISRALQKEYHGKGYGTEILDILSNHYAPELKQKKYLLNGHELQEIIMVTGVDNIAAQRTYEKLGGWHKMPEPKDLFGRQNYVYRKIVNP